MFIFYSSFVKVITYRRSRIAVRPAFNISPGVAMAEHILPLDVHPRIKAERGRISPFITSFRLTVILSAINSLRVPERKLT